MEKPKIRFKGYQEDWEQRKLGELGEISTGSTPSTSNSAYYSEDGIPWVTPTDINELTISDTPRKLSEEGAKVGRVVPANTILCTCIASIGKNTLLTVKGSFNQQINSLTPYDENDAYFLLTDSEIWSNTMKRMAASGTMQIVNKTEFSELKTMVPSLVEQQAIGTYFHNLDHLITLHQRKCEETKILKKYMLQKMFPQNGHSVPEIRFSGFTEDWEQRKLEDFGKATGGTSIESEFSEDGIYKVISIGSYSENSVYNDQGIRAIKSDKTSNRVLSRNDLTMILNDKTTSGNIIGRVLLIEESGIYVYNQRTERIEINLDEYDPVFLYEMLNAPNIREKIIKQAQGNTQIYVNWTAISLLEYMIPSKEEQVKIGEYLHSISNLITLHQQKCDELRNIKKFMLQNMFI